MCVRHGVDGAKDIINEAGTISNDENTFLLKLISLRDAELKREGLGDVDRDQGYKNVLNSGNVDLKTPFTFVAYGDEFTIDGILDLGENEQETTDKVVITIITENRMKEAAPTTVFKNPDFLDVGGMSSKRYRDLIQLDLSGYSSESKISKVLLSLCWYYPANMRAKDTIIEVYRPASAWNPDYVSWNTKNKGVTWTKAGGDWYDKNGALQGSTPYATLTIKGSVVPNSKYYDLDITDLVKEYVSGKYENTGLILKAKAESDNYIAFYSSKSENKPSLTVTLEPVIVEPEPEEPPIVTDPEEPITETNTYIMIKCESLTEAHALIPMVRGVIGDKTIEIYSKA